ncbi:RND family transporter [Candidatus Poribacteria bacterium]|nr:RND family transporter [Candidatus Poribacteria bacterium]
MRGLGRFIAGHPKLIITLLLSVTVGLGYFTSKVRIRTELSASLPQTIPAVRFYSRMKELFTSSEVIFIGIESNDLFSVRTLGKIADLTDELESMKGVKDVISFYTISKIMGTEEGIEIFPVMEEPPQTEEEAERVRELVEGDEMFTGMLLSQDMKAGAVLVVLDPELTNREIRRLYRMISDMLRGYEGPERFYLAGKPVVEAFVAERINRDMRLLFPIAVGVAMIVLGVSFKNVRGVLLPISTVILSVVWVTGIQGLLGIPLGVETSMIPMLLVSIGTAYGIHLIHQFHEEIREGYDRGEAVERTLQRRGNAVLIAGLTTIAGFLSLCLSSIKSLRAFGFINGLGVFLALLISLIFIPAWLVILRRPQGSLRPSEEDEGWFGVVLSKLGWLTFRRGWIVTALFSVLTIVFAAFIPRINTSVNEIENFSERDPIRVADEWINAHFAGTTPLNIVFETEEAGGLKDPEALKVMEEVERFMLSLPHIRKARSLCALIKKLNMAMHEGRKEFYRIPDSRELTGQLIFLYTMSTDPEDLKALVTPDFKVANMTVFLDTSDTKVLREVLRRFEEFKRGLNTKGLKVELTGLPRILIIFEDLIIRGQIKSVAAAFGLVFIITSMVLRSIGAGLLSLIPLFTTVVMNFGIMGLFGIHLTHANAITASIAIGIGIDYAVHYINRYRMIRHIPKSTATVGRAIIYNASAVALGFLVLALSSFSGIRVLGEMVAMTMLISAAGALLFLPAVISVGIRRKGVEKR